MQDAQDLSLLQYVDRLLFGPTVAFEKQSAYGVTETVERLKAACLSVGQSIFGLSTGLVGSVSPNRVSLCWRNPWTGNGLQPYFQGSIVSQGDTVTVVGKIGVPWYMKALFVVPMMVAVFVIWNLGASGALKDSPPGMEAMILALFGIGMPLSFVLFRLVKAADYQIIADALDAAVS